MIKLIFISAICVVIGLIVGFIIGWFSYRTKIDEVSDEKPVQDSMVANAMQLSNELKDYIYEKDNKLYIRVVKHKK